MEYKLLETTINDKLNHTYDLLKSNFLQLMFHLKTRRKGIKQIRKKTPKTNLKKDTKNK